MKFDVENKYEEIDNKIKTDIKKSYSQFNIQKFKNIIPLNKIEIYNEISKEAEPTLFSLKNRIRHTSIENQNEINYFRLSENNFSEIKNKLCYINNKINEINNKIQILIDKNLSEKILIKNNKEEHRYIYSNLFSKENLILQYHENLLKNISYIENRTKKLLKKFEDKNENNNKNSLKELKEKLPAFIESSIKDIDNKLDKINYIKNKLFEFNEIKKLKDSIKYINQHLEKMKENKIYLDSINILKTNINKIQNKIECGLVNQLKLSSKENNEIFQKTLNHLNKILNLKDKTNKTLQDFKFNEKDIIDLRTSCLSKNDSEIINNIIIKKIYNLNENQSLFKYELEKLEEYIFKTKSKLSEFLNKLDFYKNIKNIAKKIQDIKDNFTKEIKILYENKNFFTNLISSNIKLRKQEINKLKNEKNIINSNLSLIHSLIKKNINNNNNYKRNIIEIEQNLISHNIIIEKYNLINIKFTHQKEEIKEFNNKLFQIENKIENVILNNIDYENMLRKSINNYNFEIKKRLNEMTGQILLNKKTNNNLIIYLNNLEKNIINHKKLLLNKIQILINNLTEINKRNKEYFTYNNKLINKNKIEIIKKLNSYKDNLDKVIEKYMNINEDNKSTKQKIQNLQELLNKNREEINEGFKQIKIYLKNRIINYNK